MTQRAPIGIFDSGYGGLTIFQEIRERLPDLDFVYLGDNARAPYGDRSFDLVYAFTRQAVFHLFEDLNCPLVILACNTASAKALRTIQQKDLPFSHDPSRRVLGVIRPTAERADSLSRSKHIGVLGTAGTIASDSYTLEIAKLFPHIVVTGEACPMWVPLVENRELDSPGADYFIRKNIESIFERDPQIDTLILACTHYPLLLSKIRRYVPAGVHVFSQGAQVADSLADYLNRHPEMNGRITRGGNARFLTTESPERFAENASFFLGHPVCAEEDILAIGG